MKVLSVIFPENDIFPIFRQTQKFSDFFQTMRVFICTPPPPFALLIYLGASHNTNKSKIEKIMMYTVQYYKLYSAI